MITETTSKSFTFDVDIYSDIHKDVYGYRPNYMSDPFYSETTTDEQKQAIWDQLIVSHDEELDRVEKQEAEAVAKFESDIAKLIEVGAGDRETAIRWWLDSLDISEEDAMYGPEYVCYKAHLPYNMAETFAPYL